MNNDDNDDDRKGSAFTIPVHATGDLFRSHDCCLVHATVQAVVRTPAPHVFVFLIPFLCECRLIFKSVGNVNGIIAYVVQCLIYSLAKYKKIAHCLPFHTYFGIHLH